jgi:hypothetical protein
MDAAGSGRYEDLLESVRVDHSIGPVLEIVAAGILETLLGPLGELLEAAGDASAVSRDRGLTVSTTATTVLTYTQERIGHRATDEDLGEADVERKGPKESED